VHFPLPEATLTLSTWIHPEPIRLKLCGDHPVAMDNLGTDLNFFEPMDPPANGG
jgi:hypothetical protein